MESININKIIIDTILEKKSLIFSLLCLLSGYFLQDIVFVRKFGKFVSDIPGFISNMNFKQVADLAVPYLSASVLFYIDDIIQAKVFPEIEMAVIKKITNQMVDSMETMKKPINVTEFILNLKKTQDIKNIYNLIISYIVPTTLVAFALLYYFSKSGVKTSTIYIIMLVLLILMTYKIESECAEYAKDADDNLGVVFDNIQDIVSNYDTVLTSSMKNKEMDNIEHYNSKCKHKIEASEVENGNSLMKLSILGIAFTLILDGMVIRKYLTKQLDIEIVVSIIMMVTMFVQYYGSTVLKIKSTMPSIGRFSEMKKYFSQFKFDSRQKYNNLVIKNGDIKYENINLKYENKVILQNMNLEIKGNQIFGIVGEIGSGKTSLLKMLIGLLPYGGKIYIDGQDISLYNNESVSKNIAYIPQHVKLFNRTILENINYGTTYTEPEVWKIINEIGLNDFYNKFEHKLKSNVGKEGNKLSGGQKQILALTRAIIQDKKIILLDEPTASLDKNYKTLVIDLLTSIKNRTIIIVTHDKTLTEIFNNHIDFNKEKEKLNKNK